MAPGIFLAKLAPDGASTDWAVVLGQPGSVLRHQAVAVAPQGNPIVGATLAESAGNGRVIKLAGVDGAEFWRVDFNGAGIQFISDVAVDENGLVAFAGGYQGETLFEGGMQPWRAGDAGDGIVGLVETNGAVRWVKPIGDGLQATGEQVPRGVAFRGCNVVVVGHFLGGIDLGDGKVLTTDGFPDMFWAEYAAANGAFVAGGIAGNPLKSQSATGVAADASGRLWIAGPNEGQLKLGTQTAVSNGARDGYVGMFDVSR